MSRRISLAFLALMLAVPLGLSAQLQVRSQGSTEANDPDDVPDVTVTEMGSSFTVGTGPAALVWDVGNTADGEYNLKGTFTLLEPSSHRNYYGLIFGGGGLESSSQNYLYFLIAQDGSFLLKHRANDEAVHDIVGRTAHDAVNTPGDDGMSVNELEVRVGGDDLTLLVNGTVVHTQPKSGMAGRTNGIYGVRVNHVIPGVKVDGLGVSR
ncbi:MAG: hypothetical protein VX815_04840 [Gemmatimonadota bacterium]|nr:hypothetical protein [Gemmatimonadota bacterium]